MKRKRLTIIFFSVMILAATPSAMHHFHRYIAAAQNHAQVELLNFLLSYGAPATESQSVPQAINSTEQDKSNAASETARANQSTSSPLNFQRKRMGSKNANASLTKDAELSLAKRAEQRHFTFKSDQKFDFDAVYFNSVAKVENLKSLLGSNKLDRKKVALAWQRELGGLVRVNMRPAAKNAPLMRRASMERVAAESLLEAEAAQPAPKAEDCSSKLSADEF
jgi:hypothetical protein